MDALALGVGVEGVDDALVEEGGFEVLEVGVGFRVAACQSAVLLANGWRARSWRMMRSWSPGNVGIWKDSTGTKSVSRAW